MAKWGEGDPRWIVEERPDATNVNNWHWTERDVSSWSKDQIKLLFEGAKINMNGGNIKITTVEKCDGEAHANNRKGKLIFFYEWALTLKWEGSLNGMEEIYSGTINIPNLSEENDISEVDIQISLEDGQEGGDSLKEIIHTQGKQTIKNLLQKYVENLRIESSKGLILPNKDMKPVNIKNLSSGFNKKVNMQPVISNPAGAVNKTVDTTILKLIEKFQCKAQDLYEALTRKELVTAFTRGEVKMNSVKGGNFELFGGNISGTFEDLIPGEKIVQRWRYKQWPAGHFSTVTITFKEMSDYTELSVIQIGVPTSEADVTKNNWDRYYWNSIKQTFGYGAFLP